MAHNDTDQSLVLAEIRAENVAIDTAHLLRLVADDSFGAVASFQGSVRATENGRRIHALHYEHHSGMAPKELRRVLARAVAKFSLGRVACVHRVGTVPVGDAAVAIAVSACHRDAAFDGCRFIIDELKRMVPIWKTPVYDEVLSGGGDNE